MANYTASDITTDEQAALDQVKEETEAAVKYDIAAKNAKDPVTKEAMEHNKKDELQHAGLMGAVAAREDPEDKEEMMKGVGELDKIIKKSTSSLMSERFARSSFQKTTKTGKKLSDPYRTAMNLRGDLDKIRSGEQSNVQTRVGAEWQPDLYDEYRMRMFGGARPTLWDYRPRTYGKKYWGNDLFGASTWLDRPVSEEGPGGDADPSTLDRLREDARRRNFSMEAMLNRWLGEEYLKKMPPYSKNIGSNYGKRMKNLPTTLLAKINELLADDRVVGKENLLKKLYSAENDPTGRYFSGDYGELSRATPGTYRSLTGDDISSIMNQHNDAVKLQYALDQMLRYFRENGIPISGNQFGRYPKELRDSIGNLRGRAATAMFLDRVMNDEDNGLGLLDKENPFFQSLPEEVQNRINEYDIAPEELETIDLGDGRTLKDALQEEITRQGIDKLPLYQDKMVPGLSPEEYVMLYNGIKGYDTLKEAVRDKKAEDRRADVTPIMESLGISITPETKKLVEMAFDAEPMSDEQNDAILAIAEKMGLDEFSDDYDDTVSEIQDTINRVKGAKSSYIPAGDREVATTGADVGNVLAKYIKMMNTSNADKTLEYIKENRKILEQSFGKEALDQMVADYTKIKNMGASTARDQNSREMLSSIYNDPNHMRLQRIIERETSDDPDEDEKTYTDRQLGLPSKEKVDEMTREAENTRKDISVDLGLVEDQDVERIEGGRAKLRKDLESIRDTRQHDATVAARLMRYVPGTGKDLRSKTDFDLDEEEKENTRAAMRNVASGTWDDTTYKFLTSDKFRKTLNNALSDIFEEEGEYLDEGTTIFDPVNARYRRVLEDNGLMFNLKGGSMAEVGEKLGMAPRSIVSMARPKGVADPVPGASVTDMGLPEGDTLEKDIQNIAPLLENTPRADDVLDPAKKADSKYNEAHRAFDTATGVRKNLMKFGGQLAEYRKAVAEGRTEDADKFRKKLEGTIDQVKQFEKKYAGVIKQDDDDNIISRIMSGFADDTKLGLPDYDPLKDARGLMDYDDAKKEYMDLLLSLGGPISKTEIPLLHDWTDEKKPKSSMMGLMSKRYGGIDENGNDIWINGMDSNELNRRLKILKDAKSALDKKYTYQGEFPVADKDFKEQVWWANKVLDNVREATLNKEAHAKGRRGRFPEPEEPIYSEEEIAMANDIIAKLKELAKKQKAAMTLSDGFVPPAQFEDYKKDVIDYLADMPGFSIVTDKEGKPVYTTGQRISWLQQGLPEGAVMSKRVNESDEDYLKRLNTAVKAYNDAVTKRRMDFSAFLDDLEEQSKDPEFTKFTTGAKGLSPKEAVAREKVQRLREQYSHLDMAMDEFYPAVGRTDQQVLDFVTKKNRYDDTYLNMDRIAPALELSDYFDNEPKSVSPKKKTSLSPPVSEVAADTSEEESFGAPAKGKAHNDLMANILAMGTGKSADCTCRRVRIRSDADEVKEDPGVTERQLREPTMRDDANGSSVKHMGDSVIKKSTSELMRERISRR